MNKSLKETLENVYVSSKELKENNESTQFKEIATHILSGHFEIKKNNSVFKVYPIILTFLNLRWRFLYTMG